MHPDAEVIEILDDLPEATEPWAQRTLEVLSGRKPDIAFTSEDYGEPWAKLMGSQHCAVDRERLKFPISGTQLRSHLAEHWQMLTPPAKAYFAKRVCVLGVESSGTTTLARSLAQQYQTVWVPEVSEEGGWTPAALSRVLIRFTAPLKLLSGASTWDIIAHNVTIGV
ncbi:MULTISPECIES: AAA family ATPase [unclassified Microcoleus]|uniref:AAA family ATPase n=1 Tax=unclassified Microcoleus TaxID=2642155 RepID=UPI002FD48472